MHTVPRSVPFLLVAIVLAGCAAPAPSPAPPPVPAAAGLRCAHDPCSQVVLAAEDNAEEPFVAVAPADAEHIVVLAPVNGNASVEAFRWLGFATSFDGGATWTRGFVTQDLAGADPGVRYDIASDPMVAFATDGTVVAAGLAWSAGDAAQGGVRPTGPDIAVWRSTDGGRTFPSGMVLSKALGVASGPGGVATAYEDRDFLAVDAGTGATYLTWSRLTAARVPMTGQVGSTSVFYTRSDDHGQSWSEPVELYRTTAGPDGVRSLYGTTIAARDDVVLVAGRDGFRGQYVLLRSADGGATWAAPVDLHAAAPGNYNAPSLALWPVGEALHAAAAVAEGEGYPRVQLLRSEDGGAAWGEPVLVSGDKEATKRHPTLAQEPGTARQALTFYDSTRGDTDDLDVLLLMLEDGIPTNLTLRLTEVTNAPGDRLMDYMGLGFGPGGGFAAWDDRDGEALRIRGAAWRAP